MSPTLKSIGSQSLTWGGASRAFQVLNPVMPSTAERQNQVTTINQVTLYQYGQTAAAIRQLKASVYKSTTQEKYAYRSPDAQTFRNKRPPQSLLDAGWTYTKVKFQRIESCMSPRQTQWQEYQNLKRRATVGLAMRLILKANNGFVPEKGEIADLLSSGIFRSHARTASAQKSLAYASYRRLRKLDNRLRNQPERFADVQEWVMRREQKEVPHVQQ